MISRRWCLCLAGVVASGIGVIALSGAAAAPTSANAAVTIREFSYSPGSVTINAGDSVTWTNGGQVGHTVTTRAGAPQAFDSGNINRGGQFTRTFTAAGTYSYQCAIHGAIMSGSIIVVSAPSPSMDSASSPAPADASAAAPAEAPSDTVATPPAGVPTDSTAGDTSVDDQSATSAEAEM